MIRKLFPLVILLVLAVTVRADLKLPEPKSFTLDNGLTVQVIEKPNLPLFSFQISFKAGSIYDPVGQDGLAALTNEMFMRGTTTRTDKQIVEEIAFVGGSFRNYCSRTSAGFSGEFLSENGSKGFEILGDLLTNAVFNADEFEKIKTRTLAGIKSSYDNPSAVATTLIWEELLPDNRYAHSSSGDAKTVEQITLDDVKNYRGKMYNPDNCLLVVCGDITVDVVKKYIESYLKDWQGKTEITPVEYKPFDFSDRQILMIDKEDASQTQIRVGLPGLQRDNPDYYAFNVAKTIYAGSFTSRLVDEIRVNRGLSYGVRLRANYFKKGGINYVDTFTKNASVGEVLEIIVNEANRMMTEPITADELKGAISYQNGLYPLGFETSDDMVSVFSSMWLNNIDKSFYEDFQSKLKNVTVEQVMQAAQKYFPKDYYRVVLVGKATEVTDQLAPYGTVTVKPLSELQ